MEEKIRNIFKKLPVILLFMFVLFMGGFLHMATVPRQPWGSLLDTPLSSDNLPLRNETPIELNRDIMRTWK